LGQPSATTAGTSVRHSPAAAPGAEAGDRLQCSSPGPPAVPVTGEGREVRGRRRGGGRAAGRRGARRGAPGLFKSRGPYTRASPALPAPLSLSQGLAACLAAAAAAAPPRLAGDPRPAAAAARGAGRASRTPQPVPPGQGAASGQGDEGEWVQGALGRCPDSRLRGRCPASRRHRRLSPAVTARRGCVCLQLLHSLLPPPPHSAAGTRRAARPRGRGAPQRGEGGPRPAPAECTPHRPLQAAGGEGGGPGTPAQRGAGSCPCSRSLVARPPPAGRRTPNPAQSPWAAAPTGQRRP
jgi:hypothetical protein